MKSEAYAQSASLSRQSERPTDFSKLFKTATGFAPFDYQERLAASDCKSLLIDVPTGLGKTAAVVMAWLWNRVLHPDAAHRAKWPRRLVYCLPMRTLVEQTCANTKTWLTRSRERYAPQEEPERNDLAWLAKHSPVVLMGGEELEDEHKCWDVHPERPCVLIGTQDMLLSRALNRGYGMSRYRWPMHFGLLNNDALWVLDETQLIGVGVETSAQLNAFRNSPRATNSHTWWMSATLDPAQLATVDHPEPKEGWPRLKLESADLALDDVKARFKAKKPVTPLSIALEPNTKKDYGKRLAEYILKEHQPDSLTLVVVNRVGRAQDIYRQLLKAKFPRDRLGLVHSRFRPLDREKHNRLLGATGDRIVIATQAVEAGVDVSARLLITELAPWASLVQRFGRCNRRGEFTKEARISWVDIRPKEDSDDLVLPYTAAELKVARAVIRKLEDVGPRSLEQVEIRPEPIIRPVLRRKDMLELFDTTPDLCGNDLDISRYIREGDDTDVQVFWRDLKEEPPKETEAEAERHELCRVSVGQFRKFLDHKSKPLAYSWDPLAEKWARARWPRPGAVYSLDATAGGYSEELGWTGDPGDKLAAPSRTDTNDKYRADPDTFVGRWINLREHTAHVLTEMQRIAEHLSLDLTTRTLLETAVRWHDIGKAHPVFQQMLTRGAESERQEVIWAKSDKTRGFPSRNGFRHELASALAWLLAGPPEFPDRDLVAYLIAAHHGKVRLSIRSLPGEKPPKGMSSDIRVARGICDGDELLATSLDGLALPAIKLDLSFMEMGAGTHGVSWLARMVKLRDTRGPFHLGLLETLLRAADMRASAKERQKI